VEERKALPTYTRQRSDLLARQISLKFESRQQNRLAIAMMLTRCSFRRKFVEERGALPTYTEVGFAAQSGVMRYLPFVHNCSDLLPSNCVR
jgi:hypothetical protein